MHNWPREFRVLECSTRTSLADKARLVPTVRVQSPRGRPMPDLRSSILDPRLLFLLEIVVIHLDAEDDDAAHCGDEVGPEDCEALAKDAKHNTLQHKGDAANANH